MSISNVKLPLSYNVRYRKDCMYCKYNNCNGECCNCDNAEYDEANCIYNCNCLQQTKLTMSICPYFIEDKGELK